VSNRQKAGPSQAIGPAQWLPVADSSDIIPA
jgi:hypothetical protein